MKHCEDCSGCFTIEIEIGSTNKTKTPEEVLEGDLVEQVVVDAVLGLVQQPSLLGDVVPDGPGRKLLVEGVLHVVHQHLNFQVNLHLLLHPTGQLNSIRKAAVTWNVNHLNQ